MTVLAIKTAVARSYDCSLRCLNSHSREASTVRPRQVAMYLAYKHAGQTLEQIGRAFHRNHTTVYYAVTQIGKRRVMDKALDAQISQIEAALKVEAEPAQTVRTALYDDRGVRFGWVYVEL